MMPLQKVRDRAQLVSLEKFQSGVREQLKRVPVKEEQDEAEGERDLTVSTAEGV